MAHAEENQTEPSLWKWVLQVGALAGVTGIVCCVAPMVLFALGLAGGVWAISFADFFYDRTSGIGVWTLRGLAVLISLGGILLYRRKQNQCSIDPKRRRKNLALAVVAILLVAIGLYLSLEKLSGWYFARYVVPAQQSELQVHDGGAAF